MIVGNLGADPELRKTQGGHSVASLSVATNRVYFVGEKKNEETTWWKVVVWGAQAENCAKYLSKGKPIAVHGHMKNTRWTDDKGIERYGMELHAREVKFIGGGGGGGQRTPHPADRGEEPPWAGDEPPPIEGEPPSNF